MNYQLAGDAAGVAGLSVSEFRATPTITPDNERA